MTTTTMEAAPARATGMSAAVVPLIAIAMFINYVDRGNLATAAPLIKDELHLSGAQIGLMISAFSWTYTPAQILAGWMAERINAYRTLAIGLALWAVATAASGLVTGFAALFALRLALGLGESAIFPCSSKLIGQHLPEHKRGAANGLVGVGLALGPAFGTLAGGLLMARLGWRPTFIMFGLISLLWLWPWLAATRQARTAAPVVDKDAPALFALLRRRELWGAGLGHFANNYAFYFVVNWLPLYLVKARGFTVSQMATTGALIYVVYAASCFSIGHISDALIARGASVTRVRKGFAVASSLIAAATMAACAVGDGRTALIALFIGAFGLGFNTTTIYSIGQTLAGPSAAGKWVGWQNGMGNVAGIVGPIVTGLVLDRTGGDFGAAFAIAAAVTLLGVVGWGLMIRKIAPLDWSAGRA
jgi:MFS family permease